MQAVRASDGYILIFRNNIATDELASEKYRVEANEGLEHEGNPPSCSLAMDRGNESVMNDTAPVAFFLLKQIRICSNVFIFVKYLDLIAFRHSLASAG